jgi:hypothetical protein
VGVQADQHAFLKPKQPIVYKKQKAMPLTLQSLQADHIKSDSIVKSESTLSLAQPIT